MQNGKVKEMKAYKSFIWTDTVILCWLLWMSVLVLKQVRYDLIHFCSYRFIFSVVTEIQPPFFCQVDAKEQDYDYLSMKHS